MPQFGEELLTLFRTKGPGSIAFAMFWRLTGRLAVCLGFLALGGAAQAQYDDEPKVEASFIAEDTMIAPGATRTVALREVIREGWHTYWINPGDSGAPTEILWQLPEGWSAGPIQWPYPARMPVGPLMNYGYENEVVLLTDITAPADAPVGETVTLPAKVQWLVCADICIPEDAELSVSFTVAAEASPVVEPPLFAEARSKLPRPAPWPARFEADAERFTLFVESAALTVARPHEAVFFPYTDGQIESAGPQTMSFAPDGLVIQTETGWQLTDDARRAATDEVSGVLVLTGTDGRVDAFEVLAVAGEVPAVVRARTAGQITAALELLVDEYGLRVVLLGGEDAADVADELEKRIRAGADGSDENGKRGVLLGVVVPPTILRIRDRAPYNQAADLSRRGIPVALQSDAEDGARALPLMGLYAVQQGLGGDAALRALTVDAARMYGIDDRVGTLEVGKDADVLIYTGHPFDAGGRLERVIVGGREVPELKR